MNGTLPLHHRVLDALLSRGLVEHEEQVGQVVRYRLTSRGKEVAQSLTETGRGWA